MFIKGQGRKERKKKRKRMRRGEQGKDKYVQTLWMICDMNMTHFFHYEAHLTQLI
jgi:hypothetical protein